MCETIPSHRDYNILLPKEKAMFRKKLLNVINELEALKPDVQRQIDEVNKGHVYQFDGQGKISYNSTPFSEKLIRPRIELPATGSTSSQSMHTKEQSQVLSSNNFQMDKEFQKLSLSLPHPKEETLSRHSILGPNGLRGQWTGPSSGIKVQYPSNAGLAQTEFSGLVQDGQHGLTALQDGNTRGRSDMESVLSLDDGRWPATLQESCSVATDARQDGSLPLITRQPSPPPVLAQMQQELHMIPPSRVADPRPGPARLSSDGMSTSKPYQDLHIPVKMMESFLRLAELNTKKNLETCGILAGLLKNSMFYVTTLIIPKQESTSDSCQTTDEEEIFNIQDKNSLFPLGWIHTHPTQTCFMSSIDLHTHYSYQIMLPEAIAIVMAPTDTSRTHGIFHLSDPSGVSVIRNCQERGFHPHEEAPDGSPIYEHCSHVYMNPKLKMDVIDLRSS